MNLINFNYNYNLPRELIAQFPLKSRDDSRLLIIDRKKEKIEHSNFRKIASILQANDALVLNDTKVKPVRMFGTIGKKTVDILLVERLGKNRYWVKARPAKKIKSGTVINFQKSNIKAICLGKKTYEQEIGRVIEFYLAEDIEKKLNKIGTVPLPPYINRPVIRMDKRRYQTIYARKEGAIAAPTAGLHFTGKILRKLKINGINLVYVTLDVGVGTFAPIKEVNFRNHKMHSEVYHLPKDAASVLNRVKSTGGRICAVGTTTCRLLEHCAINQDHNLHLSARRGRTDLFIFPGFKFKITDMLLTNFHLPKTTLLLLVSAFAGHELIMKAYKEAIERRYRFYSYGDCMLII